MIPENRLSTENILGAFLSPDDRQPLTILDGQAAQDWELGGVALNDPSQGLRVQVWTFRVSGDDILVEPEGGYPTLFLTQAGVTEMSGTFDQNMSPSVAYSVDADSYIRWYDSAIPGYTITPFDGTNLRLCHDDKRPLHSGDSDMLLFYTRSGNLYYRQQRDRFLTERLLGALPAGTERLGRCGMSTVNRVLIECLGGEA